MSLRNALAVAVALTATPAFTQSLPALPDLGNGASALPGLMAGNSNNLLDTGGADLLGSLLGNGGSGFLSLDGSDTGSLPLLGNGGPGGSDLLSLGGLGAGSLPGLEGGGLGGDSPLGDVLTVEQEDGQLLVGLRLNGRDGILHVDLVPVLSIEALASPEGGLFTEVYLEESDDWLLVEVLLSLDRIFVDYEGYADDRIDTDTRDRPLFGLLN